MIPDTRGFVANPVSVSGVTYSDDGGGTAVRNVPTTHPVFDTHFPRFPVLPIDPDS